MSDASLLAGRLLMAVLYGVSGLGKWGNLSSTAETIAAKGFPLPLVCAVLAASAEVVGALAIITGAFPRLAAIGLAIHTLVTAFVFHAFWAMPEAVAAKMQSIHFLKNLGLAGGFLILAGAGAGRFAWMRDGRQ